MKTESDNRNSIELREAGIPGRGWNGDTALGVIPHAIDRALCLQVDRSISWGGSKSGTRQTVWLNAEQVSALVGYMTEWLNTADRRSDSRGRREYDV